MKYPKSKFLVLLVFYTVFFSCARRASPTGGPKDSIPPVMIKAIPPVETINFSKKKFKISFDEYIKLKDATKQLVISPPQKYDPVITPLGTASKFITVKILDTLDANTTYAFNFGNSIVDNNEENELGNFKYVFSTGDFIDSLNVAGEVTDPMLKETARDIDVMLYEYDSLFTDSVIFKQKPRYIANTIDSTLYDLTNLRSGKYLLIALQDGNNDKIYNPRTDKIGFVKDTLVIPTENAYDFPIFKEIPELSVIQPKEVSKGHLIFGYEGDAKGLQIDLSTPVSENFQSQIIFETDKDTINYWYTPFEADSLNFSVSKGAYSENFTARIRLEEIDSLNITKSTSSVLHKLDTFFLRANTPLVALDSSLIHIMDQDSVSVDFNAFLSKSKTKLYIDFEKNYDYEYNFNILPKTVTDLFGLSNDSLSFKLNTRSFEDYGILNMDIRRTTPSSFIVELVDSKDVVVQVKKIPKPEMVTFNFLNPGTYFVRVTVDENNNGIWDTGNFLEKRQPETIKYFPQEITIIGNWEEDETFNLD